MDRPVRQSCLPDLQVACVTIRLPFVSCLCKRMLILLVCLAEMTLLSSQTPSLDTSSPATESPEQRMLEKRSKVVEELLQTERDYIRDLEMCVERIMVPLQQAQVGAGGQAVVQHR